MHLEILLQCYRNGPLGGAGIKPSLVHKLGPWDADGSRPGSWGNGLPVAMGYSKINMKSLMTVLLCSGREAHWCTAAVCCQFPKTMLLPTPSDHVPIGFLLLAFMSIAPVLLHEILIDVASRWSARYCNVPLGTAPLDMLRCAWFMLPRRYSGDLLCPEITHGCSPLLL